VKSQERQPKHLQPLPKKKKYAAQPAVDRLAAQDAFAARSCPAPKEHATTWSVRTTPTTKRSKPLQPSKILKNKRFSHQHYQQPPIPPTTNQFLPDQKGPNL
jgi:hypothetical protein